MVSKLKEIRLKARAKINLTLDVTGKQEDGYHTLQMIMQTVSLYDGVYLKRIEKPVIRLKCNLDWLPVDERNLAYRGAKLLQEEFRIKEGVFIELNKKIPVAAGLAGGSTDCAAVMVGMNRLFRLGLSQKKLMELGLRLGTDIPYCILRGTVLAEGVGEKLTPIHPPCPPCYVVLAKPPISVSTAFVYKNLKLSEVTQHPKTEEMLKCMEKGDIGGMGRNLCNVLETVTIPLYPNIAKIKVRMEELGAEGALMSGSGPTVFGLFTHRAKAEEAAKVIEKEFRLKDVIVTEVFHGKRRRGERQYGIHI